LPKPVKPVSISSGDIEVIDIDLIDEDGPEPGMRDYLLSSHGDHSAVKFLHQFEFLPSTIQHEMGTEDFPNFDLTDARLLRKSLDYVDLHRSICKFLD
jgi:hypothetical protein